MKINLDRIIFENRKSIKEIEEGTLLSPKFNDEGLIPCVTVENETKEVLMVSYLNDLALKKTIATNKAHYYSRSRKAIWLKGEISGMTHKINEIYIDDDQDSIIFVVSLGIPTKGGKKASCHVGYKSCFYRKIKISENKLQIEFTEKEKSFDPEIVYEGIDNPTKI